jgi:hypothetical protein
MEMFYSTNCFLLKYETKCDEPEYKYLKASDVRDQVTQFPLQQPPSNSKKRSKNYPKPFENHENLPLSVQPPYTEFPIISRQRSSGTHGIYSGGKKTKPGPVRAVYNENDMDTFDVAFHDPTKPKHTDRNGNKAKSHPFSLAVYHPASNPEKGSS